MRPEKDSWYLEKNTVSRKVHKIIPEMRWVYLAIVLLFGTGCAVPAANKRPGTPIGPGKTAVFMTINNVTKKDIQIDLFEYPFSSFSSTTKARIRANVGSGTYVAYLTPRKYEMGNLYFKIGSGLFGEEWGGTHWNKRIRTSYSYFDMKAQCNNWIGKYIVEYDKMWGYKMTQFTDESAYQNSIRSFRRKNPSLGSKYPFCNGIVAR